MTLPPELLNILACPDCHSDLIERQNALICTNSECRRRYWIHDEIPVLLIEESDVLESDAWNAQIKSE